MLILFRKKSILVKKMKRKR